MCWVLTILLNRIGEIGDVIRSVSGDDIAKRTKKIWGLNSEGEINGAWRDIGVQNMWYMMGKHILFGYLFLGPEGVIGNLALCRFHSKHVALRELWVDSQKK